MRRTQVLVIGAGPGGSAAAITLRRAGLDVVLADMREFPRDKVCGDALIPDALAALERLGLRGGVVSESRVFEALRIYAPNRTPVSLSGQFASLRRHSLDRILQKAAVDAGAVFLSPYRAVEPLLAGGVVRGARFEHAHDRTSEEVRAETTFLATGASQGPLSAFGVSMRAEPSAMALRAYYLVPSSLAREVNYLCISYDAAICPGYGWVFPGPGDIFNLGVGFFHDARKLPATRNLRELWTLFTERFPLAARIVSEGEPLGDLKGAPLRTAMRGSRFHRPGLVVLGEAAGLTFSFSGEGIGKAMQSGILAAEIAADGLEGSSAGRASIGPRYERALVEEYGDRFRGYRRAQAWLSRPFVCNLLAARANAGTHVRAVLEGLINETSDPRSLFSVPGILQALLR